MLSADASPCRQREEKISLERGSLALFSSFRGKTSCSCFRPGCGEQRKFRGRGIACPGRCCSSHKVTGFRLNQFSPGQCRGLRWRNHGPLAGEGGILPLSAKRRPRARCLREEGCVGAGQAEGLPSPAVMCPAGALLLPRRPRSGRLWVPGDAAVAAAALLHPAQLLRPPGILGACSPGFCSPERRSSPQSWLGRGREGAVS